MLADKIEKALKNAYKQGKKEGKLEAKIEDLVKAFELTKDLKISAEIVGFDISYAEKI